MLLASVMAIMAAASVGLIVYGLAGPRQADVIQGRLSQFTIQVRTLEEIELQRPFSERVLRPIIDTLSRFLLQRTAASNLEKARLKIVMAGNPNNLTVADFYGIKALAAILCAALGFLLTLLVLQFGALKALLALVVLAVVGFFLPNLWLRSKIKKRQKEIIKVLPDAIDLLSISVEAGLGFDAALARLCEKSDNALTQEFSKVLTEMRLGKTRRDALRELSHRTGVEPLNTFVLAIIQADQLGVSISGVLRIQSVDMRIKRRQLAEEQAHKAPLKMLFPMIFLIFPTIWIVILGPAVLSMMENFGK